MNRKDEEVNRVRRVIEASGIGEIVEVQDCQDALYVKLKIIKKDEKK